MPINWTDDKDVFGRMFVLTNNSLFNQLRNAVDNEGAELSDALSWGQLKSKRWLVTELEKLNLDLGIMFLCAGWYATLAPMLFDSSCKIDKIRSFDIDESCVAIADTINANKVKENWKFKAVADDIFNINYSTHQWQAWSKANNRMSYPFVEIPNTIINTSCEHIENFDQWYDLIPKDKIVILQTNNYIEIEDHINCSSSLGEFRTQSPMTSVLYEGELVLDKYTRYMRIGIK
jgi:hypothetical protein